MMTQLLTAPQALVKPVPMTYRYMVELASDELDYEGVPERFITVDVVVTEPTPEAIALLLKSASWLEGYTIVSYWQPDGCTEF